MKKLALLSLSTIILSGCVGQSTLERKTSFEFGYDQNQVQVSNISHGFSETTYNAIIKGKKHNCTILGGGFFSFGLSAAPRCTPIDGGTIKGNCDVFSNTIGLCK